MTKTTVIMYMPGHAGNFVLRLFALSKSIMPVMTKSELSTFVKDKKEILESYNRLEHYRFSTNAKKYPDWQKYHRSWADYIDWPQYRWLNIICRFKYDFMFAIHPWELNTDFFLNESTKNTNFYQTDFYCIELDSSYSNWVQTEQAKLKFEWRDDEHELFELFKAKYSMKVISLTDLLGDVDTFSKEYIRVCNIMDIEPQLSEAIELRNDWRSIRFLTE